MQRGAFVLGLVLILPGGASATTYVVNPEGTGDFPTIQAAIHAVVDGDVIELTDGTFTGDGNRDVDYLGKAITMRSQSGDPGVCTIRCDGSHTYPRRGFTFHSGEQSESVLEGISVTNGYARPFGGGIYCAGTSSPSITHCILSDNTSEGSRGGGMFCSGSSNPALTNCIFLNNSGGAIECYDGSSPTLTGCMFSGNSTGSGGGGIDCHSSSPVVTASTFVGNSAGHGGAMMCNYASPLLTDCLFYGNSGGDWGGALDLQWGSCPYLNRCTFLGNSAGERGGGINCYYSSPRLTYCTFAGNSAPDPGYGIGGAGVFIKDSEPILQNTIIAFSVSGDAFGCMGTDNMPLLTCCDIFGNDAGDWSACIADQHGINGNISEDPRFCDLQSGDLTLHEDSPCAPFSPPNPECDLIGAWPVGCSWPWTYVIRPDGTGDFATIQEGIIAAEDGDTIELTNGTFTGEGNRDIDYLGKAITVRSQSGDPDSCIIDCQYGGRGFIFRSEEDSTSVLDGVTVTNGYIIYQGCGGGIFCDGASPMLIDCRITGNVAGDEGGGMYLNASSPMIRACLFSNNTAFEDGGGIYSTDCVLDLTECSVTGNVAYRKGGGLYCGSSPVSLMCCTVCGNSADTEGGAVFCDGASPANLVDCEITGNSASTGPGGALCCRAGGSTLNGCTLADNVVTGHTAQGGGGLLIQAASVVDCSFLRNSATTGAGLCIPSGSPDISECLFFENTAEEHGGGLYVADGSPTIGYCIFGNNSAAQGGALSCALTDMLLTNCTFFENAASYQAGGIWCGNQAYPIIRNTIIAFGTGGGAFGGGDEATLTCCDIYGNVGGDWIGGIGSQYGIGGNISEDPWFCDPGNGDFALHEDSPCAPFSPPNPECDLIGAWPVGCGPMAAPEQVDLPVTLLLRRNVPNPFAVLTRIDYSVPSKGRSPVVLTIHDASGRLIRNLLDGPHHPGTHSVSWDGTDQAGASVAGGVYFYQLRWNGKSETKRMLLVR